MIHQVKIRRGELTDLEGEASPSLDTTLSAPTFGGTSPFVILDGVAGDVGGGTEAVPLALTPYFTAENHKKSI